MRRSKRRRPRSRVLPTTDGRGHLGIDLASARPHRLGVAFALSRAVHPRAHPPHHHGLPPTDRDDDGVAIMCCSPVVDFLRAFYHLPIPPRITLFSIPSPSTHTPVTYDLARARNSAALQPFLLYSRYAFKYSIL